MNNPDAVEGTAVIDEGRVKDRPALAAQALPSSSLWTLRLASWAVLALLISYIGVVAFDLEEDIAQKLRSLLLGAVLVIAAVWFIACFTGDAAAKLRHGFILAYAFTFGAFALLIAPFVDSKPVQTSTIPTVGVLQLVRGCISGTSEAISVQVSMVARCPPASWTAPAAADDNAKPKPVELQYAWLVSVGGITAQRFESPSGANGKAQQHTYSEVHGGLAVPLYVVVLAFIGGAISLSRRLPEYQRRAEVHYRPTAAEPAMLPFQARESIIFQLMQLASAPFLAMATWYIVSPSTIASAAALAFGTGFASEPVLLMIRGMVEGIRPQESRRTVIVSVDLRGKVVSAARPAQAAHAKVEITCSTSKEVRSALTNEKGEFMFVGIPAGEVVLTVLAGTHKVQRTLTLDERTSLPVEIDLDAR